MIVCSQEILKRLLVLCQMRKLLLVLIFFNSFPEKSASSFLTTTNNISNTFSIHTDNTCGFRNCFKLSRKTQKSKQTQHISRTGRSHPGYPAAENLNDGAGAARSGFFQHREEPVLPPGLPDHGKNKVPAACHVQAASTFRCLNRFWKFRDSFVRKVPSGGGLWRPERRQRRRAAPASTSCRPKWRACSSGLRAPAPAGPEPVQ